MSQASNPADQKLRGALTIMATVAMASSTDALIKLLSGGYPIHEVNTIRSGSAFVMAGVLVWWKGEVGNLLPSRLGFLLLRGLLLAFGNMCFFLAFAAMPLADVVAIYFTMPFFVAGLVSPFLGEKVRLHRWIAIVAGFGGVVVMTRPGEGVFEPAALLALGAAFFYGVGQGMARPLGDHISPWVTAFWQAVMYLAMALVLAGIFGTGHFDQESHESLRFLTRGWVMPSLMDMGLMIVLGILAGLLMQLFVVSYKLADVSFIAPFEYTSMFWAVLTGYLIFGDVPDFHTLLGAAIVVAAGLFMIRMDHYFRA